MSNKPVSIGTSRLNADVVKEQPEQSELAQFQSVPPTPPASVALSAEQIEQLRGKIIDALHTCFDPEVPVNIYELGLIYDLILKPDGFLNILMTLTTPACP